MIFLKIIYIYLFRFFFCGKELEDEKTLFFYSLNQDDTIQYLIKKKVFISIIYLLSLVYYK